MIKSVFKKLDGFWLLAFLILGVVGVTAYCYKAEILKGLTKLFTNDIVTLWLGAFAALVTVVHKMKAKKLAFKSMMTFEQFRQPFDDLFSFVSNPLSLLGSYSILRGLYLDQVSNERTYFPKFNGLEISFLWIVAGYLLFDSTMKLIMELKEILLKSEQAVSPMPIERADFESNASTSPHDLPRQ